MSRRVVAVLIVVLALGVATAPIVQAGEVSSVTVDRSSVTIQPESGTESNSITISTTSDGSEGESAVDADIEITDTPSGVTVDPDRSSVLIDPGKSETVGLTIDAANDADSGTVEGNVNGVAFDFHLEVDNPPLAGFEDEPLDLGDVLVGSTDSGDVVVEEVGGEEGLDGVEWEIVSDDPDATLSFSEMNGWSSVQTGPGGEDTATWEITADSDVDQHESLSWTVELWPSGNPDAAREVDVEARVIYPAEFGELELEDDELVFDEARDETDQITRTHELEVSNVGDLPLDVSSVSAYAPNSGLSATVTNVPDELEGQETETVDVEITADTSLSEGSYDLTAAATASDYTVDDASYDGGIEIVHATRLDVDRQVSIGDVPIGEDEEVTTEIGEGLGYNDISNLEMTRTGGPERWLALEESPSRIAAGQSAPATFALGFDTDAELGADYEWTYEVDGDDVDAETVTVTASPVPLDLGPIRTSLSGYDDPVAAQTLEMVETMDEQMQAGETDEDDISTVLAFGESTTLYLESIDNASARLEEGDHEAAQAHIVQAAAAYNTMQLYADRLENEEQRATGDEVLATAESELTDVIDEQEAYYEQQLEAGELSLIEEATIQRQLARITLLQGDEERAASLESDAESSFAAYTETVSEGERAAQNASDTWKRLSEEQFVTVAGQPLLLNPAEYDAFEERTDRLHASYEAATTAFENAGETNRAETVADEYADRASALGTARLSLFVATGIYGTVVAGVVVRTARRMYWYVQDARESVSGDFLV